MDWTDRVVTAVSVLAIVAGLLVWFGEGPALVGGGGLLLVLHWVLTDSDEGG